MKSLIIFILIITFSFSANGQEDAIQDQKLVTLHMKDGSIISGKSQSWTYGEEVIILSQELMLTFPANQVQKVVEVNQYKKMRPKIIHNDKGIYYTAKTQILAGNEGRRANGQLGYGITASAGYRWNQYLAIGIGTGYRQMIWDTGEKILPIFTEIKGFISQSAIRPFYNLELGYGIGLKDEDLGLIKNKVGLLIYPSLGLSFGRSAVKYTVDLGYLFQNAEVTYGSNFDDRVRNIHDITYQRLTLRFGVAF